MIKTENDKIFMTGGDACYALSVDDGALRSLCFGKRCEPEDDFSSLAGASPEYVSSHLRIRRGDREITPRFVVSDMRVTERKPHIAGMPSVRGEKTLTVALVSEKHKLGLEIAYTPLDRGGFAERVTLINFGAPAELLSVGMGGASIVGGVTARFRGLFGESVGAQHTVGAGECGLTVLSYPGATEQYGEAFGAFALYGGLFDVRADERGGKTELAYFLDFSEAPFALDANGRFTAPEVVFVYSDCGAGGLVRAVHDIVRERIMPERFGTKRHISLYSPVGLSGKAAISEAELAARSGADTLIVNAEKASAGAAEKYVAACSASGVRAGVYCDTERGEDLSEPETVEKLAERAAALVAAGVRHIKWECVRETSSVRASYLSECGRYALFERLAGNPELVLENGFRGGADYGMLCYAPTSVAVRRESESELKAHIRAIGLLPPCALVGYISPTGEVAFKTKFDVVSMGVPAYFADGLTQDVVRAVRAQVFCYQDDAATVLDGDCYISDAAVIVSKDKSKAYSAVFSAGRVRLCGVDEHNLYLVRETGAVYSGVALARYGVLSEGGRTLHLRQVADYE